MTAVPTLTGGGASEAISPALQWLALGFAVHPLLPNSKGWMPEYRDWPLNKRIEDATAHPTRWSRLGVEPGSLYGSTSWLIVDDDRAKSNLIPEQLEIITNNIEIITSSLFPGATGLSTPPTIRTPSGGIHYFLRNPEHLEITNVNLGGLDIIGAQNAATWPTEGYEIVVPFQTPVENNPWVSAATIRQIIANLKPDAAAGDADSIRAKGRNNHARNLLWRCCMAALRVHATVEQAEQTARDLWFSRVAEMSDTLGGEDPSAWGVHPKRDFDRTWPKACRSRQQLDELGVFFDDGYLQAWADPPKQEPVPESMVNLPVASIWRQTVFANRPLGPSITGTRLELMDGSRVFLSDADSTQGQIVQALSPVMFRNVPHARYAKLGWQAHQAAAIGLRLAATGQSWAIPTGIWWRHEFPHEMQEALPPGDWAMYTGRGVITPSGTLDDSVLITATEAHMVFKSDALQRYVPWALGPKGSPSAMQQFCRTVAGFQTEYTAAFACSLAALGLLRGWLRGDPLVGKAQPFVSIEGPAGAGKTTGIFAAVFGLAGARIAHRSEAMYSVEMTQSRCAQLVLDDQDLSPEWGDILRIQQTESGWNKTNSLRELLGLTTIASQGFALLERDQALQDRALRIIVPNTAKDRRSLLDPEQFQAQDLHLISPMVAATHQGEFTIHAVRAAGMVPVGAAVQAVSSYWLGRSDMSSRQQLVMTSAEISLRVYCWIANGSNPDQHWWDCDPDDLAFEAAPGHVVSLVSCLRQPPNEDMQLALARSTSSPLALAIGAFLQSHPYADWDANGEPADRRAWCRGQALWIHQGRMCVRPATLRTWAQTQPWPQGVRRLLFTTQQFQSDLDSLGATGQQIRDGVQFRRLDVESTKQLLAQVMGWIGEPQDEMPELS